MCDIREVKLVSVLYYKAPVDQYLKKQDLLVTRLGLKKYSYSTTLFTRSIWSILYALSTRTYFYHPILYLCIVSLFPTL